MLIHGLGLSSGSWDAVSDRLVGDHRVVTYDLRGHGRSEPSADQDYELSAHAADLDAVLSAVVGDEGAVLVGHSLGGAVILARAERSLLRIRGAVFVGSAGSAVTVPGLPGTAFPRPVQQAIRRSWLLLLQVGAQVAVRLRGVTWLTKVPARWWVFTAQDPSRAVNRATGEFLRTDPNVLARTALASVSDDGSTRAPLLRVPALILHGDRDKQAGKEDVQKLLGRLPDGQLVTLPGAGHMLPTTDSVAVALHVAEWVHHVAGSAPGSETPSPPVP
ncbi:alpha/beta fold hydrolase [Spirilliplanes yamanashiensis]|uniref:alpha/beta fold hydrolase n=1 Tax=Spirilliplanes yamanashiensis TaxID=42233 RepID=UPI0019519123|nr:alpha/beta hydrolase [Spirilliplanes yamanashiensis]MDP9816789.1 pimeloyl-ACP methyl ester carboxylesterase [Spirilliplanes yamanashiensis]